MRASVLPGHKVTLVYQPSAALHCTQSQQCCTATGGHWQCVCHCMTCLLRRLESPFLLSNEAMDKRGWDLHNNSVTLPSPPATTGSARGRTAGPFGPLKAVWGAQTIAHLTSRSLCRSHIPSASPARCHGPSSILKDTKTQVLTPQLIPLCLIALQIWPSPELVWFERSEIVGTQKIPTQGVSRTRNMQTLLLSHVVNLPSASCSWCPLFPCGEEERVSLFTFFPITCNFQNFLRCFFPSLKHSSLFDWITDGYSGAFSISFFPTFTLLCVFL